MATFKRILITVGMGILSWGAPRFIVACGVPLDQWIVILGRWVNVHLTTEEALWAAFAVLFGISLIISGIVFPYQIYKKSIPLRRLEKMLIAGMILSALTFIGCAYGWIKRDKENVSVQQIELPPVIATPAPTFPNAMPAPLPSSNESSEPKQKHYSKKDKERIADAFYDLKEILNKDARSLRDKVSELSSTYYYMGGITSIMHISPMPELRIPFNVDVLITKVSDIQKEAERVQKKLNDFSRNNIAYEEIWVDMLDNGNNSPIAKLIEQSNKFLYQLKNAKPLAESAPNRSDNILRTLDKPAKEFFMTLNDYDRWLLQDTPAKIRQKENSILIE